ncbi:hypothetical protein SAMN05661096_01798 [Marivirga sericea]|uniref:Uncharacterized protein n=1 Tax=Marivirga sericea TaxID=1028 RepID=A0A1X7JMM7_9BACT|nr:DUF6624 domain-containing protein [Marivirga sericea]SMG29119.1 hypothetical protein SAMN05661096_01798 [Marivirga sericea]
MRRIMPLLLLILFSCNTEKSLNTEKLAIELDSILVVDQKYRLQMQEVQEEYGWNSPEMGELWKKQMQIDRSNLERVIEIIDQVGGYPGKSLVGNSASKSTFYVLQHAPDIIQEKYYNLIVAAAKENELDKRLAGMYQDRYLMHRGEDQLFGTQIRSEYETDSISGERFEKTFVWPIADTTRIDSVRMVNGLGPLEDYLSSFGLSRWD